MNINIEQVEKLRDRADVSYEDAKHALEQCGGDLLDAVIFLEKQGKVQAGSVGSFDSRSAEQDPANTEGGEKRKDRQARRDYNRPGESFGDVMRRIWNFLRRLVHKCNVNHFEVYREGRCVLSVPVTLLVLLLLFFFYLTLPALIIALFFGCSYRFRGPDLGRENINDVMDGAAAAAESIKRSVQDAAAEKKDGQN